MEEQAVSCSVLQLTLERVVPHYMRLCCVCFDLNAEIAGLRLLWRCWLEVSRACGDRRGMRCEGDLNSRRLFFCGV